MWCLVGSSCLPEYRGEMGHRECSTQRLVKPSRLQNFCKPLFSLPLTEIARLPVIPPLRATLRPLRLKDGPHLVRTRPAPEAKSLQHKNLRASPFSSERLQRNSPQPIENKHRKNFFLKKEEVLHGRWPEGCRLIVPSWNSPTHNSPMHAKQ